MSPSEKGIIRLVREGDTEAFGELVASYQSSVYGIALSTIGDAEEAEDVAQTCFVEAFSRIGELRDGDRFSPWLFAIARNKCRDWLRHNSRRPALVGDLSELPSADPPELPDNPEGHALAAARDEVVKRAVNALPPDYRAVVVLRYVGDSSYEEIAQQLGLSASAAKLPRHHERRGHSPPSEDRHGVCGCLGRQWRWLQPRWWQLAWSSGSGCCGRWGQVSHGLGRGQHKARDRRAVAPGHRRRRPPAGGCAQDGAR